MRTLSILAIAVLLSVGCTDRGPFEVSDPISAPDAPTLAAAPSSELTVMSRNLYIGGDISRIIGAEDPIAAANEVWNEILHTDYAARAVHLANEISRIQPDLVGLQEVIRFTVGPFSLPPVFPTTPLLDFIATLQANLTAQGADYVVAIRHPNTQMAAPVMFPAGLMLVGVEQADAILVRHGVEFENAQGHTYAAFPPPQFTPGFTLRRGLTRVDASVGGEWIRFMNTHLEIQTFAAIQELQAAELIRLADASPHPVIMVGDFNSAANRNAPMESRTGSYQMFLDAGFHDLWLPHEGVRNNSGPTCCQASDLSNRPSQLDQRLDLVLARGVDYWRESRRAAVNIATFGDRPSDRFLTEAGHHLWPSDHAGVKARIRFQTSAGEMLAAR
jgi:hypothetical protein